MHGQKYIKKPFIVFIIQKQSCRDVPYYHYVNIYQYPVHTFHVLNPYPPPNNVSVPFNKLYASRLSVTSETEPLCTKHIFIHPAFCLFQSMFCIQCDLVLLLSTSSILSFP